MSKQPVVGREDELRAIGSLLEAAGDRGGALLVRGEPGIGKSTLLEAARREAAERGLRVLAAAGVQSESDLPFAGLHQLVRPVLGHIAALAPAQQEALRAAFAMGSAPAPDRFLIALAALDLLSEAAAEAPLLALVEDAHWLDHASADVFAFAARRLESDPIVLVAALRDGFDSPLAAAGLQELSPERLGGADAGALLDARAPRLGRAMRERILREADGNPLALVELPVAIERLGDRVLPPAELPLTDRLEHAFAARSAELPEPTRALLLIAALEDGGSLKTVLDAGARVDPGLSLADLAAAAAAGLVDMDGACVRFRHPLVRSAIRRAAGPGRRQAGHAALARALAAEPERAVWHRAAAVVGHDDAVAGALEETAAVAVRRGALATAVAALERAAALTTARPRRVRLLLEAAEHGFELGRRPLVERLLSDAEGHELAPLERARVTWIRESFDDGVPGAVSGARRLADVAEQTAAAGDRELALDLLGGAALRCWWGDPDDGIRPRLVAIANRLAPGSDDPRAVAILGWADPIGSGPAVIERLHGLDPHAPLTGRGLRLYGMAATSVADHELASAFLGAAVEHLRREGAPALLAQALILRGWALVHLGAWPAAVADLEEGTRLAAETSQPLWRARARAGEAMLAGLRGDRDGALALAAQIEQVALPVRATAALADLQHARGTASLAVGDHADAFEALARLFDRADPAHHSMKSAWAVGDLAEAAVYAGRASEAAEAVRHVQAIAARTPGPRVHVALRHARAMLAPPGEEERRFLDALGGGLSAWPFARARLQLAYGAWLRRSRRVSESRAPLRAARDAFDVLGGSPWGDRARQELRASGERSRRRSPDARDELTPQELQIAELAAGGLSNREIGQRLYLSHRTVGSHLYRVFPKLGVTSRNELRDALAEG